MIVVEVNPGSFRPARPDPVRPDRQLALRVVVPIPALGPMQADVNFVGCPDEFVGQARPAAGADDNSGFRTAV